MSIFAGLSAPVKIAGIFGLSSWLLLHQTFTSYLTAAGDVNKATPVLMGHGDADPLVQYPLATQSAKVLQDLGFDVTLKTYR